MRSLVLSVWWCSVTAAVLDDVVYLRAQTNTSIQFSCQYPDISKRNNPFAFQLSHSSPDKKILYYHFETDPFVEDHRWRSRIRVQNDQVNRRVLLILEVLQLDDSDLYRCVFYYHEASDFKHLNAKNPITLFVEGEDMKPVCNDAHKPLLYALSCATGLLFISVLIIVAANCNNPSGKTKSKQQFPTPVYEVMNGVRDKATLLVQNNDPCAAYAQPRKENPYIN